MKNNFFNKNGSLHIDILNKVFMFIKKHRSKIDSLSKEPAYKM